MKLVVAPRMRAGWAYLRHLLAVVHVTAVPALPLDLYVPFEDDALLHVLQQLPVPLLMLLLDLRYLREGFRHVFEPLLSRHAGEVGVPVSGLALPGERLQKILLGQRSLHSTHLITVHTFFRPGNINTVLIQSTLTLFTAPHGETTKNTLLQVTYNNRHQSVPPPKKTF